MLAFSGLLLSSFTVVVSLLFLCCLCLVCFTVWFVCVFGCCDCASVGLLLFTFVCIALLLWFGFFVFAFLVMLF